MKICTLTMEVAIETGFHTKVLLLACSAGRSEISDPLVAAAESALHLYYLAAL